MAYIRRIFIENPIKHKTDCETIAAILAEWSANSSSIWTERFGKRRILARCRKGLIKVVVWLPNFYWEFQRKTQANWSSVRFAATEGVKVHEAIFQVQKTVGPKACEAVCDWFEQIRMFLEPLKNSTLWNFAIWSCWLMTCANPCLILSIRPLIHLSASP